MLNIMYFLHKFREIDNLNNDEKTMNYTKPAAKTAEQRNTSYRERLKQKKIITAQHINVANIVCKNEYVGLLYLHVHAQ